MLLNGVRIRSGDHKNRFRIKIASKIWKKLRIFRFFSFSFVIFFTNGLNPDQRFPPTSGRLKIVKKIRAHFFHEQIQNPALQVDPKKLVSFETPYGPCTEAWASGTRVHQKLIINAGTNKMKTENPKEYLYEVDYAAYRLVKL